VKCAKVARSAEKLLDMGCFWQRKQACDLWPMPKSALLNSVCDTWLHTFTYAYSIVSRTPEKMRSTATAEPLDISEE
jgi:hypothetical protein